jgi:hypothetical protein
MEALESPALFETLIQKGELKQLVYRNTCEAFESMKIVTGKRLGFRFQADSNDPVR